MDDIPRSDPENFLEYGIITKLNYPGNYTCNIIPTEGVESMLDDLTGPIIAHQRKRKGSKKQDVAIGFVVLLGIRSDINVKEADIMFVYSLA